MCAHIGTNVTQVPPLSTTPLARTQSSGGTKLTLHMEHTRLCESGVVKEEQMAKFLQREQENSGFHILISPSFN
ncbi:hypothetical protein EYF80_015807 [Liparis tanakae]|uniref:Uncharacterized protein n=1 Tax=Liparis tanakae TaxID=230148 RepID=A0A4Z2I7F4_9TELE|nr:hypothetical protein EYF80_015807 [Liparis tanakae]